MSKTPLPLAIDVDGTLLRSDITQEMFWLGLMKFPWLAPKILTLIKNDRPALKALLMPKLADVFDPEHLPYNPLVLKYARAHKKKGGEVILCSGSEGALIERIADHLDDVDAGFGTTETVNLVKGNKSKFLQDRYPVGFIYMGNSTQDFDVWVDADIALAIAPPKGVEAILDKHGNPVEILEPREPEASAIFEAMRPTVWPYILMACLVTAFFWPMVFENTSAGLKDTPLIIISLIAFMGGGFMLGDLFRVDRLRAHPVKRFRPLPSGRLGASTSVISAICLILFAIVIWTLLAPPVSLVALASLGLCMIGAGIIAIKNRVFQ
ncbi:hypothetical protein [Fretibacter rubidus]|uniref:hypothetical protein n=1 Tax=Fretibacter rubidus TaxID=570162 RepID=UPI00352A08D9